MYALDSAGWNFPTARPKQAAFEAWEKRRRQVFALLVKAPRQIELWNEEIKQRRMPIPDFDHNGVLPPHIGNHAADRANMSPYPCNSVELCRKLGTNKDRLTILLGFFQLRNALRQLGVSTGFQWLDGSFMENAEVTRRRPPGDIDVVTYFLPMPLPPNLHPAISSFLPVVRDRDATKLHFKVDHILVPLASTPDRLNDASRLVDETRYWFGLFSHRRSDDVWKGMLQLPLDTVADDVQAIDFINALLT